MSLTIADPVRADIAVNEPVIRPPASETRFHLAHLDGLRALAALYVMLDHAALEVWPGLLSHRVGGPSGVALQCFTYAHFAVSVFIVLSGFCLMLPIIKNRGLLRGGAINFF